MLVILLLLPSLLKPLKLGGNDNTGRAMVMMAISAMMVDVAKSSPGPYSRFFFSPFSFGLASKHQCERYCNCLLLVPPKYPAKICCSNKEAGHVQYQTSGKCHQHRQTFAEICTQTKQHRKFVYTFHLTIMSKMNY